MLVDNDKPNDPPTETEPEKKGTIECSIVALGFRVHSVRAGKFAESNSVSVRMHHNPLKRAGELRNLRVKKEKNVVRPFNEYNIAYDINSFFFNISLLVMVAH